MRIVTDLPLPDFEHKLVRPEDLAKRVAELPRPLVFTNGCFDILHRGHVNYLHHAAVLVGLLWQDWPWNTTVVSQLHSPCSAAFGFVSVGA